MKTALVVLLSFGAMAFAQDATKNKEDESSPQARKMGAKRRLESVTWDLQNHKLTWVVQNGSVVNGKFVANGANRYEIAPDEAMMMVADEKRGFTEEEAASLHRLLDVLSLYCAESVVWWDQGAGDPVDPNAKPKPREHDQDGKPKRIERPQPRQLPGRVLVANAAGAQ